MAFTYIKATELPQLQRGRQSTGPRVSVNALGHIVFHTVISKAWEGVTRVLLAYDAESNKVACKGFKAGEALPKNAGIKESDLLPIARDKKNNMLRLTASSFFRNFTQYSYAEAGNQQYEAALDPKFGYVFQLPAKTPEKVPVVRKAKQARQVMGAAA